MTDRAQDVIRTSDASQWDAARRVDDIHQIVEEMRSQRDALVARERTRELEIVAQRRELEVRFAFEATLEERLRECRQQIDVLHASAESEVQRRFAGELAAERERVAEAQRERDEVRRELAAERRRISYRAMQRVVVPLTTARVRLPGLRRRRVA